MDFSMQTMARTGLPATDTTTARTARQGLKSIRAVSSFSLGAEEAGEVQHSRS
jgi:hypothetical protein